MNLFLTTTLLILVTISTTLLPHNAYGAKCDPDDESGLLAFKSGIKSDPTSMLKSWIPGTNCCTWVGVGCLVDKRVTSLSLTGDTENPKSFLSGTISPSLSKLKFLDGIYLINLLKISGPFPDFLFKLPNLKYIYIENNTLSGPIPQNIGNMNQLEAFSLQGNKFTGPIPSSISALTKVTQLKLGNNFLTGTIPVSLKNLTNLTYLSLQGNQLSGNIPDIFTSLKNLIILELSHNKFSGNIPLSISSLSPTLRYLELGHNSLSGKIPDFLGKFKALDTLDLSKNQFKGTVPKSFANLTKIFNLDLSDNFLVDPFPVMNVKGIESLDLSRNMFHLKEIPKWVATSPYLSSFLAHDEKCESYLIFSGETNLGNSVRILLYFLGLAYCFIGLSAITSRFFQSMENVVKHSREVVVIDPVTKAETIRHEKVWNYTIADISLLAFGTSFPQISLATIDAIRNLGDLYAGGLGPGTLVGSAAFDLFPIHAVCVVIPKAGELKKIADLGVWIVELFWSFWAYIWLYIILEVWTPNVITLWEALLTVLQYGLLLIHAYAQDKRWPYISLPIARDERPEDWVPEETPKQKSHERVECSEINHFNEENGDTVDIFSIHSENPRDMSYVRVPQIDDAENSDKVIETRLEDTCLLTVWKQQFVDALTVESQESKKMNNIYIRTARIFWQLLLLPWRFMFAFVPPCHIAHGWISFICSLLFISGIAYIVTKITDLISCVTGINAYVIAFTALASGTSWPDLVASKIAAKRQKTADSAIANITCSNSVNIYVGIGVPWLIDTLYNFIAYRQPLRIQNAGGLSFSLIVFFATSVGCISVLVARRIVFGAELGGPRLWAWITCAFFMLLWIIFVVLSSLKVSGFI